MSSYMDGVDDFYASHPGASAVTVGHDLAYVADTPLRSGDAIAKTPSERTRYALSPIHA